MKKYCCDRMKFWGWHIIDESSLEYSRYDLELEYETVYMGNIKYCPWCGKEIKND